MPNKPQPEEAQVFHIPLAGSYNTRVGSVNQLPSVAGIVGVGIVGLMVVGIIEGAISTTVRDQRFVNCFSTRVVNPFTKETTFYCIKRPGFASHTTPQAGSIGNAILAWTGNANKIISAFGATNSSIYDATSQLVTNNGDTTKITGLARDITETFVGTTATLCIASSDSTGWFYQGTTVTKIADADFPGNAALTTVGNFAHMDGYNFIMDSNGNIWNSDLNSITSWNSLSFIAANSYPDKGIGVVRQGDKIMAFGPESVQFFYNANANEGGAGTPLARVEPLTLKVGCVNASAIATVENKIYWAGSSAQGGVSVYEYTTSLNKISTPEIDSIMLLAGVNSISLSSTRQFGRSFVVLLAGSLTFVYCVEEEAWHEWSGTPLWFKFTAISAGSAQPAYSISKVDTSGKVFVINPSSMVFTDNGTTYTATIQTSKIGDANRRTFWHEIEIVGDKQGVTSPMTISYTDDDYETFVTLGTVDLMDDRPRLSPCGSSYRRAWLLTNSANTPMRLETLSGRKTLGNR